MNNYENKMAERQPGLENDRCGRPREPSLEPKNNCLLHISALVRRRLLLLGVAAAAAVGGCCGGNGGYCCEI
jgi:hypothetical protein